MNIGFNEFAGCYYSTSTFFLKRENLGIRDPHLVTPRFSVERIQIKDAFLQVSVIHLGLSSSHYDVLKIFHEITNVVVLSSQVVVDIEYNSSTATRASGLTA